MNAFLEWIAHKLGMCGHGKENNFWVRISELFFVDCPCCIFWRGFTTGFMLAIPVVVFLALLAHK